MIGSGLSLFAYLCVFAPLRFRFGFCHKAARPRVERCRVADQQLIPEQLNIDRYIPLPP
jgi:hypothetical protein